MKVAILVVMAGLLCGCAGEGTVSGPAETQAATLPASDAGAQSRPADQARIAHAKMLVYVIDGSEAMGESLEGTKKELIRAVNGMIPTQSFNVIWIGENDVAVFVELQRATTEVKKEFAEKVGSIKAEGKIEGKLEPFKEGMEKAFGMKPDAIYFLTAAGFNAELLKVVDELNKDRKVRVNAIGYARVDEKRDDLLREMAKRNGGHYKFVAGAE